MIIKNGDLLFPEKILFKQNQLKLFDSMKFQLVGRGTATNNLFILGLINVF